MRYIKSISMAAIAMTIIIAPTAFADTTSNSMPSLAVKTLFSTAPTVQASKNPLLRKVLSCPRGQGVCTDINWNEWCIPINCTCGQWYGSWKC